MIANLRQQPIWRLSPNRVWRTYQGGKILEEWQGRDQPRDSHFPEDWVGSITRANNVGREEHVHEGLSTIHCDGEKMLLVDLLNDHGDWILGEKHSQAFGKEPQLLVKWLDAAERLHIQCHPTKVFSLKHLNDNKGKTEAYYIVELRRDDKPAFIYAGFKHKVTPDQFRHWVETQQIDKILNSMHKIQVRPGDAFTIPGGLLHAIGEGVTMVEIMEPTDYVSRFEFQRGNYRIPESARYMGRDITFGLEMLNLEVCKEQEILKKVVLGKKDVYKETESITSHKESQVLQLCPSEDLSCFSILSIHCESFMNWTCPPNFAIVLVTRGAGILRCGTEKWALNKGDAFLKPFSQRKWQLECLVQVELLWIMPPSI